MSQLAIVVESKGLDSPIFIFIKLDLMLNNIHSCFEDAFIFDRLANGYFPGAGAFALRWMGT